MALLLFVTLNTVSEAKKSAPDWDKYLEKGYHQLSIGNTEEAVKIFSEKVRKYPSSAACHTGLGRALKRLGKISEAKTEFRTATEVEPAFADGFYELGVVLESDRDWQGAVRAFETFLSLKPDASQRQALSDRIRFCKGQVQ
jgi:Flp pilus assembly protein TadD